MKKLILIACLAVVAVVVAPIASASAAPVKGEELIGACTITGTATITPEGLSTLPKKLSYSFVSGPIKVGPAPETDLTTCTGVAKAAVPPVDVTVAGKASASVSGEGQLSCPVSVGGFGPLPVIENTGEPGSGHITVTGQLSGQEIEVLFKGFKFVGTGTDVTLAIDEGGSAAAGHATFAQDVAAVGLCATAAEPTKLQFTAVAAGKIG
jgi:hypothetical protein